MTEEMIKVAAGQYIPACEIQARKTQIKNILKKAATEYIDFLYLPEGFLTGYYAQEDLARKNSLEVGGADFKEWESAAWSRNRAINSGSNRMAVERSIHNIITNKMVRAIEVSSWK